MFSLYTVPDYGVNQRNALRLNPLRPWSIIVALRFECRLWMKGIGTNVETIRQYSLLGNLN